ncbi:PCI domain-containing protein [Psidium guajava]|nr:PCI domain-containing protein [Psidium guajava]
MPDGMSTVQISKPSRTSKLPEIFSNKQFLPSSSLALQSSTTTSPFASLTLATNAKVEARRASIGRRCRCSCYRGALRQREKTAVVPHLAMEVDNGRCSMAEVESSSTMEELQIWPWSSLVGGNKTKLGGKAVGGGHGWVEEREKREECETYHIHHYLTPNT